MKNLAESGNLKIGKLYMVETNTEEARALRVINDMPTHIILSTETEDQTDVFPLSKQEITGIFEINDYYKD